MLGLFLSSKTFIKVRFPVVLVLVIVLMVVVIPEIFAIVIRAETIIDVVMIITVRMTGAVMVGTVLG